MKQLILAGFLTMTLFGGIVGNFVHAESTQVMQMQQEMLRLVNIERAKYGVAPLKLSSYLNQGAEIRAKEIAQYFSHTRPDGSDCFTVLPGATGRSYIGENISAGRNVTETVASWMRSAGHRANILNPRFTKLGVGYFYSANTKYGVYWVQLFQG